jgi:hypothetical protein
VVRGEVHNQHLPAGRVGTSIFLWPERKNSRLNFPPRVLVLLENVDCC